MNGFMSGQELANELYEQKSAGDVAMPATTMHQTFRGSGFSQRGRSAVQRGRTARTVLSYGGRSDTYGRGNIQMARGSSYRGNGMRAQFKLNMQGVGGEDIHLGVYATIVVI